MAKKKTYNAKPKSDAVNEFVPAYKANRIVIFKSFEEENEYVAKERSEIPHDKRLMYIEKLRKRVFNKFLLQDDIWPSLEKVFKIMPPYTNDLSQ